MKSAHILILTAGLLVSDVSADDLGKWRYYSTIQLDTTVSGANE